MLRLELVIHEALGASASRRRAMVVDAINKEFSPQHMVQCYNQVRSVLLNSVLCAAAPCSAVSLPVRAWLRPAWCCQEVLSKLTFVSRHCLGGKLLMICFSAVTKRIVIMLS